MTFEECRQAVLDREPIWVTGLTMGDANQAARPASIVALVAPERSYTGVSRVYVQLDTGEFLPPVHPSVLAKDPTV